MKPKLYMSSDDVVLFQPCNDQIIFDGMDSARSPVTVFSAVFKLAQRIGWNKNIEYMIGRKKNPNEVIPKLACLSRDKEGNVYVNRKSLTRVCHSGNISYVIITRIQYRELVKILYYDYKIADKYIPGLISATKAFGLVSIEGL